MIDGQYRIAITGLLTMINNDLIYFNIIIISGD